MIRTMDLEVARKALSKRRASASTKRLAFLIVAGLVLIAGVLLRAGQYFGQPDVEQNAPVTVVAPLAPAPALEPTDSVAKTPTPAPGPATAPNEQAAQTDEVVKPAEHSDEAVEHAEPPNLPGSGMILVSRQPVEVRAGPSSSAPTTFGFPAGRSFRVVGHEGGFAKIEDVKSGASGWIDEAALAPSPRAPAVATPSQPKPVAVGRKSATPSTAPKPKSAKKDSQVATDSETASEPDTVQTQRRPGLIGGIFGGLFGGGNGN